MSDSATFKRWLPALSTGLPLVVVFIAVLSIPLAAAEQLGLSEGQIIGWIVAVYGGSSLVSLLLILRYRQPLLVTGNIFVLLFVASLGSQFSWPELVGASIVAGAIVLVLGPFGLIQRIAAWLPESIVYGLLAGAILPFFVRMFSALGDEQLMVGGILVAFLLTRRALGPLAILPALLSGVVIAGVAGRFGPLPDRLALPVPEFALPEFSLSAIVTAAPVMVVLIALQANVPSVVYLRGQGYQPPERTLTIVSGAGSMLGSFLGPTGMSLSLPATALCAGPDAGELRYRHRSGYIAAAGGLAIALLAGFAAELTEIVPHALLDAVVGLAVINVLSAALGKVTDGPLLLGPMFAFGVALSDLQLFGLGPFFWALVAGLGVSALLERDGWRMSRRRARGPQDAPSTSSA